MELFLGIPCYSEHTNICRKLYNVYVFIYRVQAETRTATKNLLTGFRGVFSVIKH